MHNVELILEETIVVERSVVFEMSEEQYNDYINNNSIIDSLLKKSTNTKDFVEKCRSIIEKKGNPGFTKMKVSNLNNDMKNRQYKFFDTLYENLGK